ncbi:MAG: hypothetical protein WC178_03960 [Candidatus Paceibacterota bacterium]
MNASKKKFLLNTTFAIFSVVSFSSLGLNYFMKGIEDSSAKIIENKKSIYALNDKNKQLVDSKKKYIEIEEMTDRAFKTILDKNHTVDFIEEVEAAATENKVKLRIQTSGEKGGKVAIDENAFISSSDFSFVVGGTFEGVMKFLYNLENFKYDVSMYEINMRFGDFDQYNEDMVLLSFKLKLYQKNI